MRYQQDPKPVATLKSGLRKYALVCPPIPHLGAAGQHQLPCRFNGTCCVVGAPETPSLAMGTAMGMDKNFPPNFNFHLTFHRESALGVTKGKSRPLDRGIFVRLQQMQHPTPQTTLLCARWWGNCSMEGASCWRNLLHHYISANQLQETREGLRCKWFESQVAALVPKNYTVMCYTPSRT